MANLIWKQVLGSSNVKAIAYDEGKQECYVQFLNGDIYVYEGVGPGIWEELQHTTSKGRYVQIQLRRAHTARKVSSGKQEDSSGESDKESEGDSGDSVREGDKRTGYRGPNLS